MCLCLLARSTGFTSLGLKLLSAIDAMVGNFAKRTFSDGLDAKRALVYAAFGFLNISSVVAFSIISPLYITTTLSAISETKLKSCEIKSIAIFVSC